MTTNEEAQLSSLLLAQIERHWPIDRVVRLQRIKSGLVNLTFKATIKDGQQYVLRLYHPEIALARIRQEHALLEHLEKVGFPLSPRLIAPKAPPTWKPVALHAPPLRHMALMTHLPGEDRYTWDTPPQS
ncbi:MAG: phosphotransferase, partial [Desulfosarcinaceae bacterium]